MRAYLWLGLPVVALHASVAYAAETGDMRGRVVDEAGNPIAGASITVSGAEIAGVRTATADANGNFAILGLPVGAHEVLVESDDFAPVRLLATVRLDETVNIPATLTKSTIQEVVVIEAEEPVIDTTRSAISQEVTDDLLQNLPVGRSYQDAVQMLPGIYGKVDTIDGTPGSGNPSVRGEGAYGNNYYVDGISTRDPATKTFGSDVQFDAIESIQVYTDGAPAEFGQATGMMVNVVTKDGGDEHHGTVAYYFSSHLAGGEYDILDVAQAAEVPTERRKFMGHEVSITAGGPIVKEKLWYFASVNLSAGWSRFEGMPEEAESLKSRGISGFGKLTWFATPDLTFQYQISGDGSNTQNNVTSPLFAEEAQEERNDYQIGHIFTAKWRPLPSGELELKASYLPVNINVVPQYGDKDTPQIFNEETGQYTGNANQYDYNHRDRLGAQLEYTQIAKAAGSHRIKGGVEYWVVRDARELFFTGGAGTVPGPFPYETLEDFPDGYDFGGISYAISPSQGLDCSQDINSDGLPDNCSGFTTYQNVGELGHRGNLFGVYIQDDWRPVDVLSLNLGFRLDTETLFQNEGTKVTTALMPAPRVGVAWDVTGDSKTLVSANYGRYYDLAGNGFADWGDTRSAAVFGEFASDAADNDGDGAPDDVDGDGNLDEYYATNIQDPAGSPLVYCTQDSLDQYYHHMIDDYGYDEETAQAEVDIAESYCDGNLRPYHMDKVAIAVEREIIPNLAIGVRGIWSQTVNLPEDINVNLFDTWVIANTPAKRRDYRALEFTVEKSLDKNWGALASWTISESKGHMPGQFELSSGGSSGSSGNDVGVYLDDVSDPDTRAFLYESYDADPNTFPYYVYPDRLSGLGTVDDDAGYYGYLPYHSLHQIKVNGFYTFDFGTTLGLVYEYNSGRAWQKRGFNRLYGDYYNFPEGRGSRFMPPVHYIDLRVGHRVKITDTQSIEVNVDIFNVPNLKTPVTYYENDNESFGLTMFRQTPTSIRAGVKYTF